MLQHWPCELTCVFMLRQDPDGAYIARWVPELAPLPCKYLHQPWLAPPDVLEAAGVHFGAGPGCYPHRITTAVPQVTPRAVLITCHVMP